MKIIRSTKCSTKFATNKKKQELQTVLEEFGARNIKQAMSNTERYWKNNEST